MLMVNQLIGFGAGISTSAVTRTLTDSASDTSGGTTTTFTSKNIGTATSDRLVVVGFCGNNNSRTISGVTIGGVSATVYYIGTSQTQQAGFAVLNVTSGTTATIAITWSGNQSQVGIAVWSVYGANATPTATNFASTTDVFSASMNVPAGGAAFGVALDNVNATAPKWTWGNLTEDVDASLGAKTYSAASAEFATAQTGLSITADIAASSGGGRLGVLVLGPA